MTAVPMPLDVALNHQGFTVEEYEGPEITITLDAGVIVVPPAIRSRLKWERTELGEPELGDDFYLSNLPVFDVAYAPVLLSHILDRYRTRRIAYNTPGQWRLAFRRWANLTMPYHNQRYVSTAVALPLDSVDATTETAGLTEATSHGLDVGSDFPQSLIGGDTDYATAATDRRSADNTNSTGTTRQTGRNESVMALLAQQRAAFLNVDTEVLMDMEPLFLGLYDQGEGEPGSQYGNGPHGVSLRQWWEW